MAKMEFDNVLKKYIGEMGKFQKIYIVSLFLSPLAIYSPMVEIIFHGLSAKHVCSTKQLDELSQNFQLNFDEVLKITAPSEEATERQQCHVLTQDYANFTLDDIQLHLNANGTDRNTSTSQQMQETCNTWHYDQSQHGFTLAERFDLVCDKEWLLTQTQTYNMAGMLVGIFVFGWIGDRYGRRPAMLSSLTLLILSRIGGIFAPVFPVYVASAFLCLGAGMGFFTQGYLLGVEMVGPKWRSTTGILGLLGFSNASIVTPGLAYWLKNYIWVMVANSAFLIPFLSFFWLLPESSRWLFATGRIKEGKAVLDRMARVNGATLPEDYEIRNEEKNQKSNLIVLFKTPEIRKRTITNCILWFTISLVCFGLLFNAVNLSGSIYINLVIAGIGTIISWMYSQLVMDIRLLGRRRNLFIVMMFSAVSLLCMLPVPKDYVWVSITLYQVGMFAVNCSFNMIYVLTPETMPTEVRSTGMSFASTCARVGAILSPYFALLGKWNKLLPSIIMGVLTILTASLVFLLPETLGQTLPDTIKQVEEQSSKRHAVRPRDEVISLNAKSSTDC